MSTVSELTTHQEKEPPDGNSEAKNEVIMCTDETGMQLYLSEKAANRLSWILTGIMAALCLPVIILAFMAV